MNWILYATATAVALATADLFVKLAAGKLSTSIAVFLYGTCTFLFGLSWVIWQRFQGVPQYAEPAGLLASIGVGVAFSLVTAGLYATFVAGAPISLGSPFIRLTGLLLASLFGIILLGEAFTWRFALGMVLAIGGIYLIITR